MYFAIKPEMQRGIYWTMVSTNTFGSDAITWLLFGNINPSSDWARRRTA